MADKKGRRLQKQYHYIDAKATGRGHSTRHRRAGIAGRHRAAPGRAGHPPSAKKGPTPHSCRLILARNIAAEKEHIIKRGDPPPAAGIRRADRRHRRQWIWFILDVEMRSGGPA